MGAVFERIHEKATNLPSQKAQSAPHGHQAEIRTGHRHSPTPTPSPTNVSRSSTGHDPCCTDGALQQHGDVRISNHVGHENKEDNVKNDGQQSVTRSKRREQVGHRWTAAVVVLLAVSACSSANDTSGQSASGGDVAPATDSAPSPESVSDDNAANRGDDAGPSSSIEAGTGTSSYVAPPQIEDFNPVTYADRKLRFDVQERLVQSCMADSGYQYAISQYPLEQRGHSPLMVERVPAEGYQQTAVGTIFEPSLSGDEGLDRYGEAAEACFGKAFETMYGEPRSSEVVNGDTYELPSTVYEEYLNLPGADPWASTTSDERYTRLLAVWSQCVSKRGVDAASIEELAIRFSERQPGVPPDQAEIDAATADYHCREETDYYATVAQIQQGYVDEWLSENAAAITDLTAAAAEESTRIVALAYDLGVE